MILIVGVHETKDTKELLYKFGKSLPTEVVILTLTNKPIEEQHMKHISGAIAFGKDAKQRLEEFDIPVLALPASRDIKNMNASEKKDIWEKSKTFIKSVEETSSKHEVTILTQAGTRIEVGKNKDISWNELEMIVKLCDYLEIDKFTVEFE